jgi:large subunit ribosomal protein L9
MKVLLLKDVYKLGRAGDVKKVANGYGRNYLIPQGLATLATPGAMNQADRIREAADKQRTILNQEMSGVAELLAGQKFSFPVRASETGKLYGSVTTRMVADVVNEKLEIEVSHRQIETQPLRNLGIFTVPVRLTIDLAPEITVILYRAGETIDDLKEELAEAEAAEEAAEAAEAAALEEGVEEEAEEGADAEEALPEAEEEEEEEEAEEAA